MGIPLLYLLLLVSAREAISQDRPTQLSSALSFLHRDFEARIITPNAILALPLPLTLHRDFEARMLTLTLPLPLLLPLPLTLTLALTTQAQPQT